MRICFRIVAIILLETQRTTASQRVPLLRRRYPATDSVSDHPFGLNNYRSVTQQQGRLAGIAAWHLLLEIVHGTDLYGARGTAILYVAACRQISYISNFVD